MTNEEIVEQIQNGIDIAVNQERPLHQTERYVRKIVWEFCGFRTSDLEDYVQEGYIGLLNAARKYEKNDSANFLTFATYYIRGAIWRYFEYCSTSVRIPSSMRRKIRKYQKYQQQYIDKWGKEPECSEVKEYLKISDHSLMHLEKLIHDLQMVSLDKYQNGEDGNFLSEYLQSNENTEEFITQSIYHKELKKALDEAMSILDWRTRIAIQSVYYQQNSMEFTAGILGCSRQMVSDRIHRGFYKILQSKHRKELESFMWEGYHMNPRHLSNYVDMEEIDIMGSEFLL